MRCEFPAAADCAPVQQRSLSSFAGEDGEDTDSEEVFGDDHIGTSIKINTLIASISPHQIDSN